MKNLLITTFLTLSASPVFASVSSGRTDDSMTLVYLFLGLCGLIIFLQMIPIFALVYGMAKGIFKKEQIS